ncbi:MAG: DUF4292 domain-containing protein [Flavobacteriaceae bacterium]|nr:DUF4292 domain-containing protein [Flavobacteriaceae bacterium]
MNKHAQTLSFLLVLALIIVGCKSTKLADASTAEALRSKAFFEQYQSHETQFETLSARLNVKYRSAKNKQSLNVSLRMKNNETIWMSASVLGITVARAVLTPEKVSYYESINNTFYEGDYALVSQFLGERISYGDVQNLLLGQAIHQFKNNDKVQIKNPYYFIQNTTANTQKQWYVRAGDFKLSEQKFKDVLQQRSLNIAYPDYITVEEKSIPETIHVLAQQQADQIELNIEFKNIRLNQNLNFPFRIPSGASKIEL